MTSGCGPTWGGLDRVGGGDADFMMDNFGVADLGPVSDTPACATLEATLGTDVIEPGHTNPVTTTLTGSEAAEVTGVEVQLNLPDGWTAKASDAATAATQEPGAKLVTHWDVTAPADADGTYDITATASYTTTTEPNGTVPSNRR